MLKNKPKLVKEFKSPSLSEMESYVIDDRTTLYFEKGTPKEIIEERIKKHKAKLSTVMDISKEHVPQDVVNTRSIHNAKKLMRDEFGEDY